MSYDIQTIVWLIVNRTCNYPLERLFQDGGG